MPPTDPADAPLAPMTVPDELRQHSSTNPLERPGTKRSNRPFGTTRKAPEPNLRSPRSTPGAASDARAMVPLQKRLTWLVEVGALIERSALMNAKGWSCRQLSRATAAGRVFYVIVEGDMYFPSFFVDPRFAGWELDAVCMFLDTIPREHGFQLQGEAKLQFICTPTESLGGMTPLEAIELGEVASVWRAIDQMIKE